MAKEIAKLRRDKVLVSVEVKFSIKKNKKYLNRKVRRYKGLLQGCFNKKLAGDIATTM